MFSAVLHGENPTGYPDLAAGAQVTAPQAAYLKPVVWQIASTYRWALLGGTDDRGEVGYDPATDPDPLDEGGPVEPGGDLPDFDLMEWTADGYIGPTLAGPQPSVSGDLLQFRGGTPLTAPITVGASAYGIAALRPVATTQTKAPIIVMHSSSTWWQGAFFSLTWNGYLGAGKYIAEVSGDITAEPVVQSGASAAVIEWWTDGETISISVDGAAPVTTQLPAALAGSARITLFGSIDGVPAYDTTAIGIASAVPDAEGRAAARAWVAEQGPLEGGA